MSGRYIQPVGRLILWDIDGTLLRAGPVAREAFGRAVASVVARAEHEIEFVQMSGKTDPQIAREMLVLAAVEEAAAEDHVPAVIAHLEAELATAEALFRENGTVLPGVVEVLEAMEADPDVTQTILTGNTAANARAKLDAFGLTGFFDLEIGAFGSDAADRLALVPIALDRARRRRGIEFAPEDVWVIGDAPNDHACAKAAGVRCVLVATGRPAMEELEALGADGLLPDLSDVDGVLELLRS
jgi:phosphoglycolate phosphatase-like HAD superfamily hydrolase